MDTNKRIVKSVKIAIVDGKWHIRAYDQHGNRFIERDRIANAKAMAERIADEMIGR